MDKSETEAKTILDAGMRIGAAKPIENPHPDSAAFVIVPEGCLVEYLEREPSPMRRRGFTKLHDIDSFGAFYKAHGHDHSAIYVDATNGRFVGVLNDNPENNIAKADWRDYGCEYTPKFSPEWQEWKGRNKQKFDGNEAFAIWLEDNLEDVTEPENGKLLEIALNMRVHSNAAFSNAVRLADGNTEFSFTDVVEGSSHTSAAGKVRIPDRFEISIPVFEGRNARTYPVAARFRTRLAQGKLTVWYELIRPLKVHEAAVEDMIKHVEGLTGVDAYLGTP